MRDDPRGTVGVRSECGVAASGGKGAGAGADNVERSAAEFGE